MENLLPGKVSVISVLLKLLLLGCAVASEQQTNVTLVIDIQYRGLDHDQHHCQRSQQQPVIVPNGEARVL
jgi:hypothetical protein